MPIQAAGAPQHVFTQALLEHLYQPSGFVMLGAYLSLYWMSNLMPASCYSFEGGIDWAKVGAQLLVQDVIQYSFHLAEHKISAEFYKISHKAHHRFTNPKLFDAFNATPTDTFFMVLVPLIITSRIVPGVNVWTYMAFGSIFGNWLCLIHSEVHHPWDSLFRSIGFGTAADHHVHHKEFVKNYGHLFMYADRLFGTYKEPMNVKSFNKLDSTVAAAS